VVPEGVAARGRFVGELPAADLAEFNRWLCITRLRAAAGIVLFALATRLLDLEAVAVAPVVAVSLALATFSGFGLLSSLPQRAPLAFFYGQSVVDLGGVTVGILTATSGDTTILFTFLFALVIVPMGLASIASGLLGVIGATACHLFIIASVYPGSWQSLVRIEAIGLPVLLLLVVQQCWFYAGHLARKNRALADSTRRLEDSSRAIAAHANMSDALFDVARTLASTTQATDLLSRLNTLVAEHLGAPWASTFLIDEERGVFRLVATTTADAPVADLAHLELPATGWPAAAALREADVVSLGASEIRRVPAVFTDGQVFATVLLAGLQTNGTLAGFLAVGFRTRPSVEIARAIEFLRGMAQHAGLVLRNARLLEDVRLASDLKSEFVGAISHELRSPLNVTLGYLEMLTDGALGPLAEQQRDALRRIRRESIALLDMITALLDLNRLEAGRLPIARHPVELRTLFRELVERLPEDWRHPDVAITVDVAPNVPILHTDGGKVTTIVRNLLHNALKFTERGWVSITGGMSHRGDVVVSIRDTGIGIPHDALGYIFDMFRQVPGAGGGGVGLGLHLVSRLVTALGATIDVESRVGSGTTFTVTLPGRQVLPADDEPGIVAA